MTQFLCVTITFKQTSADLVHPVRVALSGCCEKRTEEQERIGIEKVENKLKPCPFCGGEAKHYFFFDGFFDYGRVKCEKCNVMLTALPQLRRKDGRRE